MPPDARAATLPAELIPRLQQDTMQRLGLPAPPAMRWLRTLDNPYSAVHVLEFDNPAGARRLFLKEPKAPVRGHPKLQARLQSEFDIMDRVHDLLAGHGHYQVAKPLAYYPEYPVIATLDAGEQTLRSLYTSLGRRWAAQGRRQALVQLVRQCGLWLHDFQQHTDAGAGSFDVEGMLLYLRPRFDLLQASGQLSAAMCEALTRAARDMAGAEDMRNHQRCGRHNDFASHNILAEGDRVCIIDFSMYDTGSYAYDAVNFWLELETLKLDPSYDRGFLSRLQDEFLGAHGQLEPGDTVFKLARLQYTVTRLLAVSASARGWALPSPHRWLVRRASRRWLQALVAA